MTLELSLRRSRNYSKKTSLLQPIGAKKDVLNLNITLLRFFSRTRTALWSSFATQHGKKSIILMDKKCFYWYAGVMLSSEQLKTLSGILANLGQGCIASAVFPFIVPRFAPEAASSIFSGVLLALFFWTLSIAFVKYLWIFFILRSPSSLSHFLLCSTRFV